MADDSFQASTGFTDDDQEVVTPLVPSSEIDSPNIHAWKPSNFEDDNKQDEKEISDEMYNKIKEEMQPEIQKQAELLKKDAYDKAFEQGYQEGLAQGQDEGRRQGESEGKAELIATLQPKIDQFDSILTSLKTPYDFIEEKIYSELVDFALHVAQTVIKKEVQNDKDWILNAITESIAALPESTSQIKVYLHPDDLAFLQISQPSISEKWSLHENAQLALGTCIVKQDYSTILNSWVARYDDIVNQVSHKVSDEVESNSNTATDHG
ncbi:hypothetical protein JCM30760_08590 [Thiomicrorhabdus hydrogeniphila]